MANQYNSYLFCDWVAKVLYKNKGVFRKLLIEIVVPSQYIVRVQQWEGKGPVELFSNILDARAELVKIARGGS